jgi:hypothetical protein
MMDTIAYCWDDFHTGDVRLPANVWWNVIPGQAWKEELTMSTAAKVRALWKQKKYGFLRSLGGCFS